MLMRTVILLSTITVLLDGQLMKPNVTLALHGIVDCTIERDSGNDGCDNGTQILRFYYDKNSGVCQPFLYSGCGGNGNRFESAKECRKKCIEEGGATKKPTQSTKTCEAPYLYDGAKSCQSKSDCDDGYDCSNELCCPRKEQVCKGNYDSGTLAEHVSKAVRFFYSTQYKTCMLFTYYGTLGNANNFVEYNTCMSFCSKKE